MMSDSYRMNLPFEDGNGKGFCMRLSSLRGAMSFVLREGDTRISLAAGQKRDARDGRQITSEYREEKRDNTDKIETRERGLGVPIGTSGEHAPYKAIVVFDRRDFCCQNQASRDLCLVRG